jgi:hypothetical protein
MMDGWVGEEVKEVVVQRVNKEGGFFLFVRVIA